MAPLLSFGALNSILHGAVMENVTLQILGYKSVPGSNNNRFRLLVNDGRTLFPYAILATQLNGLIENKCLEKYTIFNLKRYACTDISSERKVIICLDIDVLLLGTEVCHKISDATLSNSFDCLNAPTQVLEISSLNVTRNEKPIQQLTYNNDQLNSSTSECPSYMTIYSSAISSNAAICPISSLTPYQNKWIIRARLIYKSALINYKNQRNEGKLFSFYLLDESGEIRATAFNEHAIKLQSILELNRVYHLSNAQVKLFKGNSAIKSDFELVINQNTKIEPIDGDCVTFPKLTFNFCQISTIALCDRDTLVDIIGICNAVSDVKKIVVRADNRELSKRDIELIDSSNTAVTASLWGVDAENFKQENHSVIAIRNAKVSDFHGHSISVSPLSMLFINPDVSETYELKRWFTNLTNDMMFQSLSSDASVMLGYHNWKTLSQVTANEERCADDVEYFSVKAVIIMVAKDKCLYRACPVADCFKKVELKDSLFECTKCNQMYHSFKWTYLLSIHIADFTDSHWAAAFKENAESFVGMPANELHALKENDEEKYYDALSDLHFKPFIFNLRTKFETFNETKRLKATILSKKNVDPLSYTKKLLGDIKRFGSILNDF